MISLLGGVWKNLEELEEIDKSFVRLVDSREMVLSQLTEISEELRSYSLSVETSPERLAQVEARLSSLENLKRKYGGSIADVLKHRSVIADEIATVVDSKSEIRRREDALRSARNIFMSRSNELSKHRRVAASKLKSKFEAFPLI